MHFNTSSHGINISALYEHEKIDGKQNLKKRKTVLYFAAKTEHEIFIYTGIYFVFKEVLNIQIQIIYNICIKYAVCLLLVLN